MASVDDAFRMYGQHRDEIEAAFPRFTFSSYLRYSEWKRGRPIEIRASDWIEDPHKSALFVDAHRILILVSHNLESLSAAHPDADRIRALIAHEIGHLVWNHADELEALAELYELPRPELHDVEPFLAHFEHEADLFGAVLLLRRAHVLERVFFDDDHDFLTNHWDREMFKTFEEGQFAQIRNSLVQANSIHDPVTVLATVLSDIEKKTPVLKGLDPLRLATLIVQEYRRRL